MRGRKKKKKKVPILVGILPSSMGTNVYLARNGSNCESHHKHNLHVGNCYVLNTKKKKKKKKKSGMENKKLTIDMLTLRTVLSEVENYCFIKNEKKEGEKKKISLRLCFGHTRSWQLRSPDALLPFLNM